MVTKSRTSRMPVRITRIIRRRRRSRPMGLHLQGVTLHKTFRTRPLHIKITRIIRVSRHNNHRRHNYIWHNRIWVCFDKINSKICCCFHKKIKKELVSIHFDTDNNIYFVTKQFSSFKVIFNIFMFKLTNINFYKMLKTFYCLCSFFCLSFNVL